MGNERSLPAGVRRASPSSSSSNFRQEVQISGAPEHVQEVLLGNRHAVPVTGLAPVDVMGDLINQHVDPFVQVPTNDDGSINSLSYVLQIAGGVLSIPSIITDALDYGLAAALAPAAQLCEAPAACLYDLHVGMPHAHNHPPSFIAPAPPVPLPSIGNLMLSGAVTVLIGGIPAARAGDVGMAFTCGSFAPAFMVVTGSSSVFIGGGRAARMGDLTIHCNPILAKILQFEQAAAVIGAIGGAVGVASAAAGGNALGAVAAGLQAAADVAADVLKATVGMDPGIPPMVMGAVLTGNPNVMIGGLPLPPSDVFLGILKGELDLEAAGLRRNRHHDDAESDPHAPRRHHGGPCDC